MKKTEINILFQKPLLYLFILLLYPQILFSQEKPKPLTINGSSNLFGQYSNRQGSNQETPRNFLRWDLNNTIHFYDLPINIRFFLSTEQSDLRQSINNFSFSFDSKKYLSKKNVKAIKFLTFFPTLEFGTCRPNYSPLTLRGISLKGVNIEFTPGSFYSAFSYGTTKKAIVRPFPERSIYKQKLIFGKLGWGKKNKSHIYLSLMHALDDQTSLTPDTTLKAKPQENVVIAAEFNLILIKNKLYVKGEVATSMLTRDINEAKISDENVPSFLSNSVNYNISSSFDYAYSIKTALKLKYTKISGGIKMVGPGFMSFGTPYLRKDNRQYDARVSQQLFKRKVSLQLYFKRMNDNLIDWKQSTTTSTSFGITSSIRLKKLPYLVFSYAPFLQQSGSNETKVENSASLFSITSGYSYKLGKIRAMTGVSFSNQNNSNELDTITIDNKTNYFSITESLNFKFPLVLSANVGLNSTELVNEKKKLLLINVKGTYGKYKKWRNTFGFRFSNQGAEKRKVGLYLRSIIPLWKFGDLNLNAEQNFYKDIQDPLKEYNELILSFGLSMRW